MTARMAGAAVFALGCVALGDSGTAASQQTPSPVHTTAALEVRSTPLEAAPPGMRTKVFLTLPRATGATDPSAPVVDAQAAVRAAFERARHVRVVDRQQDADVVLTLIGHGVGRADLRPMFRALDAGVIAPPLLIGSRERYIGAMLAIGPCGDAARAAAQHPPASCFRRVFVGLEADGDDAHGQGARPARSAWTASADALAREVGAWLEKKAASHGGQSR